MMSLSLDIFLPVFLRILGMFIMLPVTSNLSSIGKIFPFSFALSLYFCSDLTSSSELNISSLPFEFLVGCLIGLPASLTIDAVRTLGEMFDNQRGVNFAAVYDPVNNQQNSVMAQLSSNFCLVVIISAGLLENIFLGVKESFALLPINSFEVASLSNLSINVIKFISYISSGMFQAFLICAFVFILIDLASVFLSKILSQGGLNQEVFLIKTTVGFIIILACLKLDFSLSLSQIAQPKTALYLSNP